MALHSHPILAVHPGYLTGARYPAFPVLANSLAVAAVDIIYFTPFMCPSPITVTKLSIWVATGGAASSAKMGIWSNSLVSMRPLTLLAGDNAGVATTASGANADSAALNVTLSPGLMYWFGAKFTGTLPSIFGMINTTNLSWLHGSKGAGDNATQVSFSDAYANALASLTEGATFNAHGTGQPQFYMVT